ncbi:MAG: CsbD family protein [Clostridia bacterium]|nr:CsbD family protein [Clostridia bacterium]
MSDKGTVDILKGKAEEIAGTVTGDDKKKTEGLMNQAIGKVKETASDAKEAIEDGVEKIKEKIDRD